MKGILSRAFRPRISGQTGTARQPRKAMPSFSTITSNIFLAWLRFRVSWGKKNMPTP